MMGLILGFVKETLSSELLRRKAIRLVSGLRLRSILGVCGGWRQCSGRREEGLF